MPQPAPIALSGHALWPPLALVRRTLERVDEPPAPDHGEPVAGPTAAEPPAAPDAAHLLLPLTELAARRAAVSAQAFGVRWVPGGLVSVLLDGRLLGVLLDKPVQGEVWQGWLAASEADWASAFDVLLEPGDEPFEPMFGVVQAWNPVTLRQSPQLCARAVGELSATRLAALRSVHEEWASGVALDVAPAPGRIALRTTGGVLTVLTGTPLGQDDPRAAYQALYRKAALALTASATASASRTPQATNAAQATKAAQAVTPSRAPQASRNGPWNRLRGWFAADGWVRPAFALLALVVVVQNVGLLTGDDEREVRFRSAPAVAQPAAVPELLVRWKPGVRIEDTALLLQSMSAQLVGGPDASGRWSLRTSDPVGAVALLSASPLVESVAPP